VLIFYTVVGMTCAFDAPTAEGHAAAVTPEALAGIRRPVGRAARIVFWGGALGLPLDQGSPLLVLLRSPVAEEPKVHFSLRVQT